MSKNDTDIMQQILAGIIKFLSKYIFLWQSQKNLPVITLIVLSSEVIILKNHPGGYIEI